MFEGLSVLVGLGAVVLYVALVIGFFMMVSALRQIAANTDDLADMLQGVANELATARTQRDA